MKAKGCGKKLGYTEGFSFNGLQVICAECSEHGARAMRGESVEILVTTRYFRLHGVKVTSPVCGETLPLKQEAKSTV